LHRIATAFQPARTPIDLAFNVLWVGIGCKRGTSATLIQSALEAICRDYFLEMVAIAGVATLERKADESGLLEFCRRQQLPIRFFSATALNRCSGTHPSARIETAVGTGSVAEAAALLAAGQHHGAVPVLIVPKQSFQCHPGSGAVTLAIAQSANSVPI
jgi:cobalamin biosynthesis protein CbiG